VSNFGGGPLDTGDTMDVSKPGSGGFSAPILDSGAPGGAGGSGKFADVLAAGNQPPAGPAEGRSPFSTPILDADMTPRRVEGPHAHKVHSPDTEMRAGHRHASLHVVGERAGHAPGAEPARGPVTMREMANDTLKAESKIDAMIDAARRGKNFSASELIGLQAEVFRYQQTVEVISKTTEKVVGAVKQVLGTQV
jgi:hypothetical protein